jgi:hypothetical protein
MPQSAFIPIATKIVGLFVGGAGAAATAYTYAIAQVASVLQFVALTAASMATNKLLAPKMPGFSDSSLADRTQMVRSPIAARQVVYGETRVSGVLVYISTTGTKNEYLNMVIALAAHEVEEIGDVYFNDELAHTGLGPSATGRFAGYAEVYKKLGGDSQTADTNLISATASLTNGKWTSAHRLRGIAYIYVQLKWSDQVWLGGIPNISANIKGKKVFDPRTSTTAYSANAALCLRDYLTDSTYGLGLSASEIDDTAFIAAANICDEQVQVLPASPTVYENRYEANGVLYSSASPDDNIGKLLSAMGGLIAYSGGRIIPYAAGYRIPTVTLTDTDFVGPISVITKTSSRDRVNAVKGVFVSEKSEWQPTDFPPQISPTYYAQDNSIRYWRDVVLPMTTSSSAAQRISRIELQRARQEVTLTGRFRLDAMQVRAGDTVMVTLAKFGWTNKVFEVLDWHFASDGSPPQLGIEMTLRETASSVYNWNVSDEIEVDQTPTTTLPNPFSITAPTSLTLLADGTTQLLQVDGTLLPRIRVSWSAPSEEFVQSGGTIGIEYKEGTSTTYLNWSTVPGDQFIDYISSDVKVGLSYDVRIYAQSYFKVSSTYVTASVTVEAGTTPPAAPTGASISGDGVKPKYFPGTQVFLFGTRIGWSPNTESDFSHYEIKATTTDSDAATNYSWTPYDGVNFFVTTSDTETFLYNATLGAGYVRIRAVNRSGVASSWTSVGNANSIGNSSIGAGSIAAQNFDDVETTGIKTGDGSATRQVNVRYEISDVVSLTGGSPTETITIDTTNRGFNTKPDAGWIQCASDSNISGVYDFDNASNSSTTSYFNLQSVDGTNLPAGNQRFSVQLVDYT